MDVPLWLIWVVATLLAIMPLSVIPMAMKVDKSDEFSPQEKRAIIDEMKEYQLQLARDVFAFRKLARDAQASM